MSQAGSESRLAAAEVIERLGLEPLPGEGGFFRRTYESACPAPGAEHAASAIYYLVTPGDFSALHRVRAEELFHFYAGDPVELVQIDPAGRLSRAALGADLRAGQRPQWLVPTGHWQGLRLLDGGSWALLGATVCPGYVPEAFELAERAALLASYPALRDTILAFTRP